MGVHRLRLFLEQHADALGKKIHLTADGSQETRTVLVDAFGFIISLVHEVIHPKTLHKYNNCPLLPYESCLNSDLAGGDLEVILRICQQLIDLLYHQYHIELVFLIDNDRQSSTGVAAVQDENRGEVKLARFKERRSKLLEIYEYCMQRSLHVPSRDGHTDYLPPLCLTEVLYFLTNSPHVRVINVPGEVDTYIRHYVQLLNPWFTLSSDTDFVILDGVQTVFLDTFPFFDLIHLCCQKGQLKPRPVALTVYSAELLRNAFGVTTDQLALAATFTGNDFTKDTDFTNGGFFEDSIKQVLTNSFPQKILTEPCVLASLEQYLTQPVPDAKDDALLKDIPRGVFSMARYYNCQVNLEYIYEFGKGYFCDLPTFRRARQITCALLGVPTLTVYKEEANETETFPVVFPEGMERHPKYCAHYTAWRRMPRWERIEGLRLLFQRPCLRSPLEGQEEDNAATLFLETILYVSQSALNDTKEFKLLLFVMVFCYSLSDRSTREVAVKTLTLLAHLLDENSASHEKVAESKPSVRLMQLSVIFGKAFLVVSDIFNLVGETYPVAPSTCFSGTVLQILHATKCAECHTLATLQKDFLNANNAPGDVCQLWGSIMQQVDFFLTRVGIPLTGSKMVVHREFVASAPPSFLQPKKQLVFDDGARTKKNITWAGLFSDTTDICDELEGDANLTEAKTFKVGRKGARRDISVASPLGEGYDFPVEPPKTSMLPAEYHKDEVLEALQKHRVVCIQGDTGCGKSSIIPKVILEDAVAQRRNCYIVVTQPRRLAATALAKRLADTLGETVGESVGYRLGGGVRSESRNTKLLFVTTGYLLELLAHEGGEHFFRKVTHMILDEVHERSIQADMLSLVCKIMFSNIGPGRDDEPHEKEMWWNGHPYEKKNCSRLLVMSATISAEMFTQYFKPLGWSNHVPLISVGEKRFPVKVTYVTDLLERMEYDLIATQEVRKNIRSLVNTFSNTAKKDVNFTKQHYTGIKNLIQLHLRAGMCILVFLPGLEEIESVFREIEADKESISIKTSIHLLHSFVEAADQEKALVPAAPDECKVVLSTNIAETSLTIPDVKLVIDAGLARHVEYDKKKEMRVLKLGRCSKASANQRMGRAGRVSEGHVIRLFSEEIFNDPNFMKDFDEAEIYPLEYSVLLVRQCLSAYGDIYEIMSQLVEPPEYEEVRKAIAKLIAWGALDQERLDVLELGQLAVKVPVDVSLTRALLNAVSLGCAAEMVVLVSGLSLPKNLVRRFFRYHYDTQKEYQRECCDGLFVQGKFDAGRRNDLFIMLAIYEAGQLQMDFDPRSAFVRQNVLSPPQLKLFRTSINRIGKVILSSVTNMKEDDERLLKSMVNWDQYVKDTPSGEKRPTRLLFPSLHNANNAYFLQLVLAQSSTMTVYATNKQHVTKVAMGDHTVELTIEKNTLPKIMRTEDKISVLDHHDTTSELNSSLANFRPFAEMVTLTEGGNTGKVYLTLQADPSETSFKENTPQSLFRHPTALPKMIYALTTYAVQSKPREETKQRGLFGNTKGELSMNFPKTAGKLTFSGTLSTLNKTNTDYSVEAVKFSNWSIISSNSTHPENQTFICFGYNTLKMERGPTYVDYGFFPHHPLRDGGYDRWFPLVALLLANPPKGWSKITSLCDFDKGNLKQILFSDIKREFAPLVKEGLKNIHYEVILLLLCEVNLLVMLSNARPLDPDGNLFHVLQEKLTEVRALRQSYDTLAPQPPHTTEFMSSCALMETIQTAHFQGINQAFKTKMNLHLWDIFYIVQEGRQRVAKLKGVGKQKKKLKQLDKWWQKLDAHYYSAGKEAWDQNINRREQVFTCIDRVGALFEKWGLMNGNGLLLNSESDEEEEETFEF
ncbi:DEAD/DEAH box helicase/Helicase conserved C-terminal domain/Helicase associated domain (HA2), putative [Angomonas deanei]|uniref:DEAD/DEAH box helicase/Helicase conserved C-terminal domain/Helicase associated domain (HA2), putative n=1 Tax=Angomonas deanei TaxID=59799 RepID=A0A7G2C7H9_9TRYP|nr:DEAD/DEAH box helicase/Helicase conserved C-terminal domain/Helicase associated domain (HA2), putative [Angomonas deanei]